MFIVNRVKTYFSNFFIKSTENIRAAEVGLMEVYIEEIFRILSWKEPRITLQAFFLFNIFVLSVLTLNVRFYGILSYLILCVFIYDLRSRDKLYIDYNGEYAYLIKDIKNGASNLTDFLRCLRRDSPLMFACFMILFFLGVKYITSNISGITLCTLLVFLFFAIPKGIQLLPGELTDRLRCFLKSLSTPKCILAEDELIPFIQGKDFSKREADLDSLLTDRTADSVTSSLVSGITTMPSYLEVAAPAIEIEEDDLIPSGSNQSKALTGELSSDSESDNKEIQFDSDHFNTSSSEEDPYTSNLNFRKDTRDGVQTTSEINPQVTETMQNIFSNMMTSVSNSLVGNIIQSALSRPTVQKKNSESDQSDFEILDYEEDNE
ncbi:uncharacterized protein LOC143190048 [Rhynchophorus ferrugineus]|uniref:Uncharacterized protein n=1 Tax=Rhynchophorus ferrugineus TaxID=354439 RepID=A0A834I1N2_RHYFE|nr:hypothetical protein GWI33_014933 [Rhynchophorus ferrugineus]